MRKNIQSLTFAFDNSCLEQKFFSALRYSTHAKYTFVSKQPSNLTTYYITQLGKKETDSHQKFDLYVNSKGSIFKYPIKKEHSSVCQSVSLPLTIKKKFNHNISEIFLLKCFDGRIQILCGVERKSGQITNIFDESQLKQVIDNIDLKSLNPIKEYVFKLAINSGFKFTLSPFVESDAKIIDLSRLVGINIPLMIVQDMLKRDFVSFRTIPEQAVNFQNISIYTLGRPIFFDLDETLLINGTVVCPTFNLLMSAKNHAIIVGLITRHKGNLEEALSLLGLNREYFDEIHMVADNQKKSNFINKDVVFIDNEFPQRYDVCLRTNAIVLDVDMVEYLKL